MVQFRSYLSGILTISICLYFLGFLVQYLIISYHHNLYPRDDINWSHQEMKYGSWCVKPIYVTLRCHQTWQFEIGHGGLWENHGTKTFDYWRVTIIDIIIMDHLKPSFLEVLKMLHSHMVRTLSQWYHKSSAFMSSYMSHFIEQIWENPVLPKNL